MDNSSAPRFNYNQLLHSHKEFQLNKYLNQRQTCANEKHVHNSIEKPLITRQDSRFSSSTLFSPFQKEDDQDSDTCSIIDPYSFSLHNSRLDSRCALNHWAFKKFPAILQPKEYQGSFYFFTYCVVDSFDKIFSSLWLSKNQVLYGTKCDKLVLLNIDSGQKLYIPKIVSSYQPFAQANATNGFRNFENMSGSSTDEHDDEDDEMEFSDNESHAAYEHNADQHDIVDNREEVGVQLGNQQEHPENNEPAANNDNEMQVETILPLLLTEPPPRQFSNFNLHCAGIHAVVANPSKTLLACGSGKPSDTIQIYKLPSFEPYAVLNGHRDLIFSVIWTSDTELMTASRDRTLRFWSLEDKYIVHTENYHQYILKTFKNSTSFEDRGKVRDLQKNPITNVVSSLTSEGFVKLWDSKQHKMTASVSLFHTSELVCMTHDPISHLIAIGSQSHITFVDPRSGKVVNTIDSLDEGWGVRSLLVNESVAVIGGGLGRLSFYDLKAQKYHFWEKDQIEKKYLESGRGFLNRDIVYEQHFNDLTIKNAIYSISYDPEISNDFFIAGGPLQLSLKGCYSAVMKI